MVIDRCKICAKCVSMLRVFTFYCTGCVCSIKVLYMFRGVVCNISIYFTFVITSMQLSCQLGIYARTVPDESNDGVDPGGWGASSVLSITP